MQTVRSREELTSALKELRSGDRTLALVPTMGALHAGHMKLVDEARRHADTVAATIFVNPTQFGANEDFGRYPRQEEQDSRLLTAHGCDLLWLPAVDDIYPAGFATTVSVSAISSRWEGEARPGHFNGVATVVARLLLSVRPDVALFGEKDFQQLAVIRRMVADLAIGVDIIGVPTVREDDGLALSSRNAYLTDAERAQAPLLNRALRNAARSIGAGQPIQAALSEGRRAILIGGFSSVDYFALVDAQTLEPLDVPADNMRLIAAAMLGATRLIDNIAVAAD